MSRTLESEPFLEENILIVESENNEKCSFLENNICHKGRDSGLETWMSNKHSSLFDCNLLK
jgi:hypothetical protein